MNIEEIRAYCLSLPNTTEDQPFGPDVIVFRIGGKIFLCANLEAKPCTIAIKLDPNMSLDLRDRYSDIRPAYHWNKRHWNDINIEAFPNNQIEEWISLSYHIVAHKRR